MLLLVIWSAVEWRRGRLGENRALLRAWMLMTPAGFVAVLAGWYTTEIGRQPYVIYGLMRTAEASSAIDASSVATSLAVFASVGVLLEALHGGLRLIDIAPSGGTMPTSLTYDRGLLYVLNAGTPNNISGFRVSRGRLSPLPQSTRPLSDAATGPAQVAFSSDGRSLVVTERGTNRIDVYTVDDEGRAQGPFVYASADDRYVHAGANGVATFDLASNAWTTVADSGPRPTGYDHGVAYDSLRNRLYMGSGDGTTAPGVFIYDIASSTWTKPESSGPAPATFRTNEASIVYDEVDDLVTVFHYAERTHYTYDPEADAWTSQPIPDEVLDTVGGASFNGFYDPVLDAYFVYAAGDSSPDGAMWSYR